MNQISSKIEKAKNASIVLASKSTTEKNEALNAMMKALDSNRSRILKSNEIDCENAKELNQVMLKRLKVTDDKINEMILGISDVIKLKDPVGETLDTTIMDDGLELYQIACPIGMIGVIFESRPDVVPQIMSLCLKSGNGVVFKGGKEANETNKCLFEILSEAISNYVPKEAFVMIESREEVSSLLSLNEYIDLLIPRGSNDFVQYIQNNTKIPVLGHAAGICHTYVDSSADFDVAYKVVFDAKTQYPAVCNATECLIVNSKIANDFLPSMNEKFKSKSVEVRGDEKTQKIIDCVPASKDDFGKEFGDYIISVKIVDSLEEAIQFINVHGSHHTDAIISTNKENISKFVSLVDSADIVVNASTRFADGFRFGKGAEVGISTNKIHSRGPVGMEGLMIYKYVVIGNGHIVQDYVGPEAKKYKHQHIKKEFKL